MQTELPCHKVIEEQHRGCLMTSFSKKLAAARSWFNLGGWEGFYANICLPVCFEDGLPFTHLFVVQPTDSRAIGVD
jgi:hypothetical protein